MHLSTLVDVFKAVLLDNGVDDKTAEKLAREQVEKFRWLYAGQRIYIPSKRQIRQKIKNEYNGKNLPYLSAKYGIALMTAYRYVR